MDLIQQVKDAGIIGAGGAGFPTYAKLGSAAEYMLMNAAECEPLLRVDQQVLAVYTDRILAGFEAAAQAVQAEHAIIGIKKKHSQVITLLRKRIGELHKKIEVFELADFYPAGDEQILVYEVTGRIVPEGGIPIKVGCVVVNVETALNIGRALEGLPVTESFVTVSGDVPHPFTAPIPVGTPMRAAAAQAGITDLTGYAVIDGGPMMGKVLDDDRATVMKKTKAYIILKQTHPLIVTKTATDRQALLEGRSACEQCRMCTDICPRHLLGHNLQPHLLMRAVKYNLARLEELTQANLCSQCGVCTLFACPAHLKPHQINFMLKQQLGANRIRYIPKTTNYEAYSARAYRRVPVKRLILRLGLAEFDREAPLTAWSGSYPEVRISLQQHVGAPAQPIVEAGTVVEKGQLIAAVPEGALGATVHASISGTVTQVNEKEITIKVG